MSLTADRKMLSNVLSAGWSTDGEHHRRYWTRGALNDTRRSIRAFCALTLRSLSAAQVRSAHRSSKVLFNTDPGNNGAPSNVASWTSTCLKDCSVGSLTVKPE